MLPEKEYLPSNHTLANDSWVNTFPNIKDTLAHELTTSEYSFTNEHWMCRELPWLTSIRKQWRLLTKNILQWISNPEIKTLLKKYSKQSITEQYAINFLKELSTISDENKNTILKTLSYLQWDTHELNWNTVPLRDLAHRLDLWDFVRLAWRYALWSDIKLLSIAGLLNNNSIKRNNDLEGQIDTLHIRTTKAFKWSIDTIINPLKRQKRRRISPRIYEITVGWKEYILKEQKSFMHSNTHKKWATGNSAFQDLEIGQTLCNNITNDYEEIKISREKPCFAIQMDDWYQFSVYEKSTFDDYLSVGEKCYMHIIWNKGVYLKEYNAIKKQADKILIDDCWLLRKKISKKLKIWEKILYAIIPKRELSFHDFALAKSSLLLRNSSLQLTKNRLQNNIYTVDNDDSGIIIHTEQWKKVIVERIWYDYEHYTKTTPEDVVYEKERFNSLREHRMNDFETSWCYDYWKYNEKYFRSWFEVATYFLMVEEWDKWQISM